MTEETDKETAAPTKTPPKAPAKKSGGGGRSGGFASGLALILSLIAVIASGYLWYEVTERRELYYADAFNRLGQVEDQSKQVQDATAAMEKQVVALRETQDTIRSALEKIQSEAGKGRREWLLSETEQLLLIANHRLQLAHDVSLALAALRAADHQLQQLADPGLLPVRKILANEIGTLESLERIDVAGMALRLGSIATRIERLPIGIEAKLAPAEPPPAQGPASNGGVMAFLREVWRDLKGLIRVRHVDEARRPLLMPQQEYFLRENLRLMLYGAQIALLHGDAATFEQNLTTAKQWLTEYYDNSAQAVLGIQSDLDGMLKARVKTELPDISASLKALRGITGKRVGP